MSTGIYIGGLGAVSPAGWTVAALRDALAKDEPFAPQDLVRPGMEKPIKVLRVPPWSMASTPPWQPPGVP